MRGGIVGLQYLRGFCAVAVCAVHVSSMAEYDKYFGRGFFVKQLESGVFGVDIFFAISGFIITIVSLDERLRPRTSLRDFCARRFARIVPLMWVAIITHFLLRNAFSSSDFTIAPYLRAAVLWPTGLVEPMVVWTLRHEFMFYAVFALGFLVLRRPLLVMGLWVGAAVALWLAAPFPVDEPSALKDVTFQLAPVYAVEFALGMLAGIAYLKRLQYRDMVTLPIHPLLMVVLCGTAIIICGAVVPLEIRSIPWAIVIGGLAAMLIALVSVVRCPDDRAGRVGVLLGDASYSIYLFHLHAGSTICAVWSKLARQTPAYIATPGAIAGAVVAGVVIHRLVERPLVRAVQARMVPGGHTRRPPVGVTA